MIDYGITFLPEPQEKEMPKEKPKPVAKRKEERMRGLRIQTIAFQQLRDRRRKMRAQGLNPVPISDYPGFND